MISWHPPRGRTAWPRYNDGNELDAAWDPLLRDLGRRIKKNADQILEAWKKSKEIGATLDKAMVLSRQEDSEAELAELLANLAEVKKVAQAIGLPKKLEDTLNELNRPEPQAGGGKGRPTPDQIRARADTLFDGWKEFIKTQISSALPDLVAGGDFEQLAVRLAVATWCITSRSWLSTLAYGQKSLSPSRQMDHVIMTRIRIARRFSRLAKLFGWAEALRAAEAILQAKLEPDSQLAIVPGKDGKSWEQSPVDIEKLAQVGHIESWEPVTGAILSLFYRAVYYRNVAAQIRKSRPASDQAEQKAVQDKTLIPFIEAQAIKTVKAMPQPERFEVADERWDAAVKPGSKKSASELIEAHESYQQEVLPEAQRLGFLVIFPINLKGGLWVWLVPEPSGLVPIMRQIDLLNAMVAKNLPGKNAKKRQKETAGMSGEDWWNALSAALTKTDPETKKLVVSDDELAEIDRQLRDAFEKDRLAAQEEMRGELLKAMRVDRQLMANIIREDLKTYAGDRHAYAAADRVLRNIQKFAVATTQLYQYDQEGDFVGDFDARAALAVLMIDIAPEMLDAFEYESTFPIVHGLLGFCEDGLGLAQRHLTAETVGQAWRSRYLPPSQDTSAWLDPRIEKLRLITEHFREVRRSVQSRSGFKASKDRQQIDLYMTYSKPIPVGDVLVPRYGGLFGEPGPQRYSIISIYRDFVFHPEYGYGVAGGAPAKKKPPSPSGRTGYGEPQFLEADGKTPLDLKPGEKLMKVALLRWDPVRKRHVKTGSKELGPGDPLFPDIYNGMVWHGFGTSMETAMDIIEWQLNLYVDALELIPGWGQAITAARVAAAIAEFWASGTFEDLKNLLAGGVEDVVTGLWERLKDAADPTSLVELLVFGDPRLDYLLAHIKLGQEEEKVPHESPSRSNIRRLIAAFRRLGRALFKALRTLHDKVEVPMQDVRIFTATRPILAFAFHFAAEHLETLLKVANAAYDLLASKEEITNASDRMKTVASLKAELKDQQKGVAGQLHSIAAAAQALKLPSRIIDLKPAYTAILNELVRFVGRRLGTKGKIVTMILDKSGLLTILDQQIAGAILEAGLDPNQYWADEILPLIETKFNTARDQLVKTLNEVLSSKAFAGVFGTVAPVKAFTLTADGEPFEETQPNYIEDDPSAESEAAPLPAPGQRMVLRPPSVPPIGEGAAVPPAVRAGLERAFGSDLRHVRVHSGAEAGEMTGAFNVDGLATGSHIFLRPGLSPEGNRGREVMEHEVAHVLQNTGASPPGAGPAPSPVPGRPSAGLDFDPAREREAEQLVANAKRNTPAGAPPPEMSGPRRESGLQPFELDPYAVAKLLKATSDLQAVLKSPASVERARGTGALPSTASTVVEKTLDTIKKLTSNQAKLSFPKVFQEALPLIESRFQGFEDKAKTQAYLRKESVEEIAREALVPLPAAPSTGGTTKKPDQVIKREHFARELEAYILAKTGIMVGLTLRKKSVTAPSGATVDSVDESDPVEQMKLLFIYLPRIDGRSPLWGKAVDQTWPGTDPKTTEFKQKVRSILRSLLETKGISIAVFAAFGTQYKFSIILKKQAEEMVNAPRSGALQASALPDWKTYVDTAESNTNPIGLRLSFYGHASQTGAGRESHHLTQFLMADFFYNGEDSQPFKKGRAYPGIVWKPGDEKIGTISRTPGASATDTNETIQVGVTRGAESKRGVGMPAISLAATTHRKGSLHITPEADDLDNSNPRKTQSSAVTNRFRSFLPAALQAEAPDKTFNAYIKDKGEPDAAEHLYTAVQKTYRWIEHEMHNKLKASVPQLEMDYYLGLCEFNSAVDITEDPEQQKKFRARLDAIPAKAKEHNKDELAKLGWKLS